jgi:hypothetical protein
MIRTSKAPVAWPVPWNAGQQVFFRPGDVIERGEFESDLAGDYGAGRVYSFQLSEAFAAGLLAVLRDSPDDAARLIEWEGLDSRAEKLAPDEAAAVTAARQTVSEHWPPYRVLAKRLERRRTMTPIAAFRRYCAGWEGEGLPKYEAGGDGFVTLDLMRRIDPVLVEAGGMFAYSLQYAADQEGNSAAPSKPVEGRRTSNSGPRKAAGKSRGKSGSRTRSSRSRPGSSRPSTSGSTAGD